jgi:hypothetical protein
MLLEVWEIICLPLILGFISIVDICLCPVKLRGCFVQNVVTTCALVGRWENCPAADTFVRGKCGN